MKYINKIALCALSVACVSCVDQYDATIAMPEKPTDVATQEYLNTFDLLKSYISRNANSPFRLAAIVSPADFQAKGLAYSTLVNNFEGIDINGAYIPADMQDTDGTYDFTDVKSIGNAAQEAGVTIYGGALCSNQGQPAAYLNKLIEPEVIPFVSEKGTTVFADFESDAIGTVYPSVQNFGDDRINIVVASDPAGSGGKVLQVGPKKEVSEYHLPMLDVKLPVGKTLGDMKELVFDVYWDESGLDGDLRIYILPPGWINRDQYRSQVSGLGSKGVTKNKWTRKVTIPIEHESWFASLKGLTEFQIAIGLCTHNPMIYFDNIGFTWETVANGATTIDFETDELGITYPMTNGNQAVVEEDPVGKSGKVLHVGTSGSFCNMSYPKFKVKLESGMTLADYNSISLDMYLIDGKGQWGSGMRVVINGTELNCGNGPATFGCQGNAWGRGLINIPLLKEGEGTNGEGKIVIPAELAGLNEFEMAIGSGSSEWHAYIDNISLHWEKEGDTVIEKTPEEKKAILTSELEKWITGMVNAGGENITMWDVISEPLDDTNDTKTFNWAEYLGDKEYARTAVKITRESSENELKLFVGNSFNQYNDIVSSIDKLTAMVKEWQEDNATVIDGYNIRLQAIYSENANELEASKAQVTKMLEQLAATGKAVRLSGLGMIYEDADGNFVSTAKIASVQRERAAEYMEFIIKEYFRVIAPENQYGISFSSMTETNGGSNICPWTSGYGRTEMYEGIVNGLKNK